MKVPTLDHYHNSDFNEMTPQYGHAVGHAVESLSWYTKTPLLHGEAVAIGMCVSAEIALNRGLCNQATVHTHYDACQILGLPCFIPSDLTTAKIMEKMVIPLIHTYTTYIHTLHTLHTLIHYIHYIHYIHSCTHILIHYTLYRYMISIS